MEDGANINFNHDHVAMITQTGINQPQSTAEREADMYIARGAREPKQRKDKNY